jgi:hypothetical protein
LVVAGVVGVALACAAVACGSRTGLFSLEDQASDAAEEPESCADCDVTVDATEEDAVDAPADAVDAREEDATDAGPEIFDVPPPPSICPDAGGTLVYLVSMTRELYSFNPPTATFRDIGHIDCPTPYQAFSMAVDRGGTAYVLLSDMRFPSARGALWRVSTADAKCTSIPQYVAGQDGFQVYGMGFAANGDGGDAGETLYVAGAGDFGSTTGLATIDTTTFALRYIGQNNPSPQGMELTGTGDGRLFALFFYNLGGTFYIGQIDTSTGALLSQTPVTPADTMGGFSIAFWGGDFYLFTGSTIVTRYRPSDGSSTLVAQLPGVAIVGAGVSTCAP